jgi:hypothetical protein
MTTPRESRVGPNEAVLTRALDHVAAVAARESAAYWLAWADGIFVAADTRFPRHPLGLCPEGLRPVYGKFDVRALAGWYIGPRHVILPLGRGEAA